MATERWVYLKDDGTLILHEENDGWSCAKSGLQAMDVEVTLNQLEIYPALKEKAVDLLWDRIMGQ